MNERRPGRVDVDATEQPSQALPRQPEKIDAPTAPLAPEAIEAVSGNAATRTAFAASKNKNRLTWGVALAASASAFGLWLVADVVLSLVALFDRHPVVALLLAAASVSAFGIVGVLCVREWRAARQIDQTEQRKLAIGAAVAANDVEQLLTLLEPMLARVPEAQRVAFLKEARLRADASAVQQLADNTWLRQMDDEATRLINRAALTVAGAVAVVPHPVFDGVAVLWRALRLIQDLGDIYGLKPTGLSSWRLFKHALVSAVTSAGIETAGDVVIEELGRGAFESAGKRVAEGAVMMLRLKRLGAQAKQLCRPWPVQAD